PAGQARPGPLSDRVLEITVRGAPSSERNSITVNYDGLIDDVAVDDVVLLDNGLMQVRVLAKEDNRIRTVVLTAGTLGSRRHINLPGVHVNLPALTEKDLADVARGDLGIECPMEELPIIQRRIVKRCLRLGKPVVVGRSDDRAPRRMTATMANQIHDPSTRCFKSIFAKGL